MKLHTHPGLPGLALVCALGLGLVACDRRENAATTPVSSTTVGTEIDDSVVTTRVKSALFAVPDIKSFDIAVVTRKGEVQLSGFIDSDDQINRILAIVRSVEGVQGVVNEMKLKK